MKHTLTPQRYLIQVRRTVLTRIVVTEAIKRDQDNVMLVLLREQVGWILNVDDGRDILRGRHCREQQRGER